ncbi:MAG: glycosyltransferase [Actinomycetota bacterium]
MTGDGAAGETPGPAVSPDRRPRWLWVSAEVADELTTGLLVYSAGLAGAVARAGVDVTMVAIGPPSATRDAVTLHAVDGSLRGGAASLVSPLPNLSYASATPAMRRAVEKLIERGGWDAIVIDHLQVAWLIDLLPDPDDGDPVDGRTPVVFVTHNHEGSMRREVAGELPITSPRGLALRLDAIKAGRLERRALARADVVTSITEADQERFRADLASLTADGDARAPLTRHVVATPGWSGEFPDTVPPMADRPRRIGILGSFAWHVKQENLLRFVRGAGPALERAGVELVVAGTVPDPFRQELEAMSSSVRCAGWVDSIPDFLGTCRIGVVAEPLGGGFKLKSLDYVALRVPIGATTGSVTGLPLVDGVSMFEARSEVALGERLVEVIDDADDLEAVADRAFSSCEPTLRWAEQVKSLMEAVDLVTDELARPRFQGSPEGSQRA